MARAGASYMYTGPWGQRFVATVQREGGKATMEDMRRYRPAWEEARRTSFNGFEVVTNGSGSVGALQLLTCLNLLDEMGLPGRGGYWKDASVFRDLTRVLAFTGSFPAYGEDPAQSEALKFVAALGIDASVEAREGKAFARAVAPHLDRYFAVPVEPGGHTDAIVAIDAHGNIAALSHTINTTVWGTNGLVVAGVPLPDSACFQQVELASVKPGHKTGHSLAGTITFAGGKPVLVTAGLGSSLVHESVKILTGILANHGPPEEVIGAPPLLGVYDAAEAPVPPGSGLLAAKVTEGRYSPEFLTQLHGMGLAVTQVPKAKEGRGTLAVAAIDPASGTRRAFEVPGSTCWVVVFKTIK